MESVCRVHKSVTQVLNGRVPDLERGFKGLGFYRLYRGPMTGIWHFAHCLNMCLMCYIEIQSKQSRMKIGKSLSLTSGLLASGDSRISLPEGAPCMCLLHQV